MSAMCVCARLCIDISDCRGVCVCVCICVCLCVLVHDHKSTHLHQDIDPLRLEEASNIHTCVVYNKGIEI